MLFYNCLLPLPHRPDLRVSLIATLDGCVLRLLRPPRLRLQPHDLIPNILSVVNPSKSTNGTFTRVTFKKRNQNIRKNINRNLLGEYYEQCESPLGAVLPVFDCEFFLIFHSLYLDVIRLRDGSSNANFTCRRRRKGKPVCDTGSQSRRVRCRL